MVEPFHPDLQMAFAVRLAEIEDLQLGPALARTVSAIGVKALDRELSELIEPESLQALAEFGLRGEVFFALPSVLAHNPRLLAYYRLLYGLSQKEFSNRFSAFLPMEKKGTLSQSNKPRLVELAESLAETGKVLLANLGGVSLGRVRDLQLLTLGPQLRGGRLNELGTAATRLVFNRIRLAIADEVLISESSSEVLFRNASGRIVKVAFASDPDIAITEDLGSVERNLLSVEIKGGTDVSNVHNRLGEAEKSHRKAKERGFNEFWTILNSEVPVATAQLESPTTNEFFQLREITDPDHPQWHHFREQLAARLGVPASD